MHSKNDLFWSTNAVTPPPSPTPPPPPPPLRKARETSSTTGGGGGAVSSYRQDRPAATVDLSIAIHDQSIPSSYQPPRPSSPPAASVWSDNTHASTLSPADKTKVDTFARQQIDDARRRVRIQLSDHILGHGRHSSVYLAACSCIPSTSAPGPTPTPTPTQTPRWRPCSAKLLSNDDEAIHAGYNEAYMLSSLSEHPNILRYVALADARCCSSNDDQSHQSIPSSRNDATYRSLVVAPSKGRAAAANLTLHTLSHPPHQQSHSVETWMPPNAWEKGSRSTPTSPLAVEYGRNGNHDKQATESSPTSSYFDTQTRMHQETPLRRSATVKVKSPTKTRTSRLSLDAAHPSHRRALSASSSPLDNLTADSVLLLTEYCALGSLHHFVQTHGTAIIGRTMYAKLAIDLARALQAVHAAGVIHADIKPQNCMIDNTFNLKLGDFSSSLFAAPDLIDGVALGTTQYSAPELVKPPPSPFSYPVDIFAAGLTLLYLITGVEPYESLTSATSPVTPSIKYSNGSGTTHGSTPGTGAAGTPSVSRSGSIKRTGSLRRKVRNSSGAGKLAELHLHLSRGNAWEFEERRRLDELEEDVVHLLNDSGFSNASSSGSSSSATTTTASTWPSTSVESGSPKSTSPTDFRGPSLPPEAAHLPLPALNVSDISLSPLPSHAILPLHLLDPPSCLAPPDTKTMTYSDHYTPIQTFLTGEQIVPEALRELIQIMLSPHPFDRPDAPTVLRKLQDIFDV